MPFLDRTPDATGLAAMALIALLAAPGIASAHGSGTVGSGVGASHTSQPGIAMRSPSSPRALLAPRAPARQSSTAVGGTTGTGSGTMQTGTGLVTPPPDFTAQCEGEVSANCEARAESDETISNGDPNPVWSAPTPTTVPSTPPTPQINEPQTATQDFEQSGGGSGVTITEGGGPTLADCMALWEPAVHMTKQLWKNVCIRTMNGINEPQVALDSIDPGYRHPKRVARESRN